MQQARRFADVDPVVSRRMSRVRRADTKPELAVRRAAHRLGYRFRLHRRDLPGTPDLVFPRHRKVILVHGCFWHQHQGCAWGRLPRSRPEYWLPKLARNVERDREAAAALAALGWEVGTIWECEAKDPAKVDGWLATFLGERSQPNSNGATVRASSPSP
jgi:DNA mismatch endonuclease (patch repair protein)